MFPLSSRIWIWVIPLANRLWIWENSINMEGVHDFHLFPLSCSVALGVSIFPLEFSLFQNNPERTRILEFRPITMENYERINKLGQGTFGVVWAARDKRSHEMVAIKELKDVKLGSLHDCLALPEVQSLRKLKKHSNILELKDVVFDNSTGAGLLVLELMEGSLLQLMQKRKYQKTNNKFTETEIRNMCHQIFKALDYTHKNGYFHRDLKPENLLCKRGLIKIGDFGCAVEMESGPFSESVGSLWYRAPELLFDYSVYDSKIDMWSMGAIMAELFNLRPLFPGSDVDDQRFKICNWEDLSSMIPSATDSAINLIESLLSPEPERRPTAAQALQHPFFVGSYRIPRAIPRPLLPQISSHILPMSTITSVHYY